MVHIVVECGCIIYCVHILLIYDVMIRLDGIALGFWRNHTQPSSSGYGQKGTQKLLSPLNGTS
jgi:hypothetical protein